VVALEARISALYVVVVLQEVIVAVVGDDFVVVEIATGGLVLDAVKEVHVFWCRVIEAAKSQLIMKSCHRRQYRLRRLRHHRRGHQNHHRHRCLRRIDQGHFPHSSPPLAEVPVKLAEFVHRSVVLSISVLCGLHYKLQAVSSLVKGGLL